MASPSARGKLFVLLFPAILLFPFIASCTAFGVGFYESSTNVAGRVPSAKVASLPENAYVDVDGKLLLVWADEFSVGDGVVWRSKGAKLFRLDDAAGTLVYCSGDDDCPHTAATHFGGRVCDERDSSFSFSCAWPTGVREYLDVKARPADAPAHRRVLVLGATPQGDRVQMAIAFVVAGLLLAFYAFAVIFGLRKRRGDARVFVEYAFAWPHESAALVTALARLSGVDDLRVVTQGPREIAFTQGRDENQARIWGMSAPEHVPRRAKLSWDERPYQGTHVRVRIEENLAWYGGSLQKLEPLCRAALSRTTDQLQWALGTR